MDAIVVVLQLVLLSEAFTSLAVGAVFRMDTLLETASETVLSILRISWNEVEPSLLLCEGILERSQRLSNNIFVQSHRSD